MKFIIAAAFLLGVGIGSTGVFGLMPSFALLLLGILVAYVSIRITFGGYHG